MERKNWVIKNKGNSNNNNASNPNCPNTSNSNNANNNNPNTSDLFDESWRYEGKQQDNHRWVHIWTEMVFNHPVGTTVAKYSLILLASPMSFLPSDEEIKRYFSKFGKVTLFTSTWNCSKIIIH